MNKKVTKRNIIISLIIILIIVGINGATYSYLAGSKSNNTTITGNKAISELDLNIEKVVPTTTKEGLVPLIDSHLQNALSGVGSNTPCIDSNNNLSCEVYKITIENTGNINLTITGTIDLNASDGSSIYNNLKWEELENQTTEKTNKTINNMTKSTLEENLSLIPNQTKNYFIAVWLSENNQVQNNTDKGNYNGIVEFTDSAGNGTTATFSGS